MGTHHLEYGFPSTHSTNSISMALYLYTLLLRHWHPTTEQALLSSPAIQLLPSGSSSLNHHEVAPAAVLHSGVFYLSTLFLCFYAASIVYGRCVISFPLLFGGDQE